MRLYFAHCKNDYGSPIEAKALKWFSDKGWLDHLINPADPKHQNTCVKNSMDYWKGLVNKCVAIYFLRYKGQITSGVGQEIEEMFGGGGIIEMVPACDGFDLVTWNTVPPYLDYEATKRLMYPDRYQKVTS